MGEAKEFRFIADLERKNIGLAYYQLRFPYNVQQEFGTNAAIRVDCIFNGIAFNRALIPDGKGNHILIISNVIRKKLHLNVGDRVEVVVCRTERSDDIEMPEELSEALALEEKALKRYQSLTPGMQRNICLWINTAKTVETRSKRAVEMLNRLMNEHFRFGGK